jgi:hypothetical protein
MTHDDRLMNLLTDWLEEQPDTAPDQLLDTFMTELRTAPQRAAWKTTLRRFTMFGSNAMRSYAVAGAVVLAVVVGFGLWAGQPPSVGPPVTPSPSPTPVTPSPSATPVPAPTATSAPQTTVWSIGGPDDPTSFFVPLTLELPSGWDQQYASMQMVGATSPRGFNAILFVTAQVRPFEDPCARPLVPMAVGPSVDDLIDALANLPVEVSTVEETVIDGHPAKQLTFAESSEGPACEDGSQFTWRWENGENHGVGPDALTRLWAVDVDGTRLVIVAVEDEASAQEQAELQQMVDSIRLAPPASD